MPSFLVETYLARGETGERSAREQRAQSAAQALTQQGVRVRFAGATHVPEDELCFFVFDAESAPVVVLAARRARLDALRVVEVVGSSIAPERSDSPDERREER